MSGPDNRPDALDADRAAQGRSPLRADPRRSDGCMPGSEFQLVLRGNTVGQVRVAAASKENR